jgi:N-acetyl-anhydromuramyl-L-alanine amidase AmpD
MKTVDKFLPEQCYYKENTVKKRICLHHTAGGPMAINGVTATWSAQNHVATTFVINGDGTVYRMIPENYWAHHLGTKRADNTQLNKETIGIEINAWGALTFKDGRYFNAYGKEHDMTLPVERLDKPFRGHTYYQEYSRAQIDALQILLYELSVEHGIPLEGLNKTLNFELLQDFSRAGVYSHTNFRADKSDVYPARRLVSMLKMLVK